MMNGKSENSRLADQLLTEQKFKKEWTKESSS